MRRNSHVSNILTDNYIPIESSKTNNPEKKLAFML